MFSSINKTFGCCSKILVAAILLVVPNFVAAPKPFFSVYVWSLLGIFEASLQEILPNPLLPSNAVRKQKNLF